MRPVFASTAIDVPREDVHALLCDLSIRPAFTDHFLEEYRLLRIEPVGVGAGARFRVGRTGAWMDTVITAAEGSHRIDEHGHTGRLNGVPTRTVWELVEGPGRGGCELRVTFWTEPRNTMERLRERRLERRLSRGFKRAAERLKRLAEDGGDVARVGVGGADRVPS